MRINEKSINYLPNGLLNVWTNNPKIITSSIYNNTVSISKLLNQKISTEVNKIFTSTIQMFVDSFQSIRSFIYNKADSITQSLSSFLFEKPKMNMNAIYKKGQGETEQELRILPNFKKINYLTPSQSQLALEKILK